MTSRIIPYLIIILLSLTTLLISCKADKKLHFQSSEIEFFSEQQYDFIEVDTAIKMAYLDIGNTDDTIVLLVHGEPNSSFVYRNIAPALVKQNYRVIIPDLIGFGYSDKPKNADNITYLNHTKWLTNFIERLELTDINIFAHDWGGMITLRIVAERPEQFKKVAVSYSYLFDGTEDMPESFIGFKDYAKNDPGFLAGNIMDWGTHATLPDSIKAKYNSYFQSPADYYAVRKFPSLIPTDEDDPEAILNKKLNNKLRQFSKPFITIWGNHEDLMWKGKDSILQNSIKGAKNQKHYILESNHFIQEDQPSQLIEILVDFFKKDN